MRSKGGRAEARFLQENEFLLKLLDARRTSWYYYRWGASGVGRGSCHNRPRCFFQVLHLETDRIAVGAKNRPGWL